MRTISIGVLLFLSLTAGAQSADSAKQVYKESQDSVFLIYLNDSSGSPQALGSAFVVAPRTLVTNAHVVNAGIPVLAVGPVRIPVKVLRVDEKNDLAILSVEADLTSKPLVLATQQPDTGELVYAIGNPEGLEKTISQGIVSGKRNHNGRDLLQITTPISHGSSGGPILNANSEVVGVAVGMLEDGQNLNFAVPVSSVRQLLETKAKSPSKLNVSDTYSEFTIVYAKAMKAEYSDDANSEYQRALKRSVELADALATSSDVDEVLSKIACMGASDPSLSDAGITAARRLVALVPNPDHTSLLAYTLLQRSETESFRAQILDDNKDKEAAASESNRFREQASAEAATSVKAAKGKPLLLANFVLGSAKADAGDGASAIAFQTAVANGGLQMCDSDLGERSVRSLIAEYQSLNKFDEAEKWFNRLASQFEAKAADWDSEGDRRYKINDLDGAASAYEKAAAGSSFYAYDFCYASNNRYFQPNPDRDAVLGDGKKCIDASVKNAYKSLAKQFDTTLPTVYRDMADVLKDRGVNDQALIYINESLSQEPENSFSMITKAEIMENLQRYTECVSAAQAAIRMSEGKYSWMQFDLGNCYFDQRDWTHAEAGFRIAAEADKTNAPAAFNLALSLLRQGYSSDARTWFNEALKRNPDAELRSKILNELQ